jgi:queuosine precursor transporter
MLLTIKRYPKASLCVGYAGVSIAVNLTISWWPPQHVLGIEIPPGLLLVGAIFVMRDYTQRAIGNWVIPLTLLAAALTYFFIGEKVGLASGTAFAVSEGIDWALFKWLKRDLKDRILISSAIATPFDGLIFLSWMGWLDPWHFWDQQLFWVHYTVKMIASILMWFWLNSGENTNGSLEPAE